jgi:predicted transcriptional regulator
MRGEYTKASIMKSVMVRIKGETHRSLHELAADLHMPLQEVVAEAVEEYRRRHVLEKANTAYAALRADPSAWQEELAERALWDTTLLDGLDDL